MQGRRQADTLGLSLVQTIEVSPHVQLHPQRWTPAPTDSTVVLKAEVHQFCHQQGLHSDRTVGGGDHHRHFGGCCYSGFLSQADKAKASAAKSLASSALKECQVYLVDPTPGGFSQQTGRTNEITLTPPAGSTACTSTTSWAAAVTNGGTYTAALTASGAVNKTCTVGSIGCSATGTW